jgi:hypothetical protein
LPLQTQTNHNSRVKITHARSTAGVACSLLARVIGLWIVI